MKQSGSHDGSESGAGEVLASVCVTAYQHVDYIEKCLESIISQKTRFNFEIVLGEDDSSDGTRDICKRFKDAHPSLISLSLNSRADVIYVAGSATGRANFLGNIARAKGRYIFFCDGDDFWTDDKKLQICVDKFEENPKISMITTRAEIKNEDLTETLGFLANYGESEKIFSPSDMVLSVSGLPISPMQTMAVRASICEQHSLARLINYGGSMHAIIHLQASLHGSCCYLPRTTAVYRHASKSSVVAKRKASSKGEKLYEWNKLWLNLMKAFSKFEPSLEKPTNEAILNRLLSLFISSNMSLTNKAKITAIFLVNVRVKFLTLWFWERLKKC
ncbi:glycosyltransferase [Alloalcanivorax mobilis]|uniref:glycosyltransferase n=1 Tax=Alloalcanivorax mobilis TaxID=2019569 RepID=UPI0013001085|nr:glycosyltransferase [Alloalcanivorax mobilis]